MSYLLNHFNGDLIALQANGYSSVYIFREYAKEIKMHQINSDEESIDFKPISKKIISDINSMPYDKNSYKQPFSFNAFLEDVSPTLSSLLEAISPKLNRFALPSLLIGNIITSCVASRNTSLQVGAAITLQDKKLIKFFSNLKVCCAYDEFLRFRDSAAAENDVNGQMTSELSPSSNGMIQAVADNLDKGISSLNGLK